MNKTNKSQPKGVPTPLEVLKDISKGASDQMKYEASQLPKDFAAELFGIKTSPTTFSAEITPGEVLEIKDVFSGKRGEIAEQRQRIQLERRLIEEEKILVEKRTNELRLQLKALQEELVVLANRTEGLAKEIQVAAMQAPVESGIYHITFFERLLEYIKSFRKRVENASVWLYAFNKRAAKRNAWGAAYKKFGAKYLLSGEHYLQRSAG